MAMDDDRRIDSRGTGWPSRLRMAWRALLGSAEINSGSGGQVVTANRAVVNPQALLIESLIGGLPSPAIVLDLDARVIAFNEAAAAIAPALRRGEPALITLRMPELVDAIR